MKLTIGMADSIITINLLGQAKKIVDLCHIYFKGFLCPAQGGDAEVKVSILNNLNNNSPVIKRGRKRVFEQRLPTKDVMEWLSKFPGHIDDFPITERTISSFCQDGLLLFNPESSDGCIFLKDGPGCFRPVYRLFWMYLAQVLGERKGCFVHSAALVRDGKGYIFLGDSGAGKSSLARLSEGINVFSDDSPVLCERDGDYLVFPSPFHQLDPSQSFNKNMIRLSARVEGFYFLIKDNQTYLEDISKRDAVSLIINRHILFFHYLSARARSYLFDLFLDACDKIPYYNLRFCLDKDIWEAIDSSDRRIR
ncbi:MAG TPA: hypothetical protein VJ373_02250 [Desulfatiglandales bacterium]|nr:hypothetical protein [Desulfatiglandales bacterium]